MRESTPGVLSNEDVFALARELREAYRDEKIPVDTWSKTRATTWIVRAAAGLVSVVGLATSTVLTFALGPEVGAVVCVVFGCASVFGPLIASNAILRRVYRRALRQGIIEGGASYAQPFAIPAKTYEPSGSVGGEAKRAP